ncbi:PspC domain-containing protein [Corynebacterium auris]|uniref:PspC domain-containing protein n=1 Tax=Corynebacterium auris TaxID=44750 RepID=UPI0025B2D985|nr:PspC domain-containing protein [Corynebacterium auris]
MNTAHPNPTPPSTSLRGMWDTRPPRIPEKQGGNAVIAGVCEGIGARYGVDPVLIRLAFAALTLAYGGGIFLYLLLWLNMPLFGTTVTPWGAVNAPKDSLNKVERDQRSTGWALLVGLVIFFPSIALNDGGWAASSLLTLFLGLAGLYLLHKSQPVPPHGLLAQSSEKRSEAGRRVDTTHLSVPAGYEHPAGPEVTPPSWDPLGVAPDLWHLPDPGPEPAPAPRKGNRVLRGFLIALIPVSVIAIAVLAVPPRLPIWLDEEDATRTIVVEDDLADTYDSSVGSTRLDLSRLEQLEKDRSVTVDHGIGTVTLVPPQDVRVELECTVGVGEYTCPTVLNGEADGPTLHLSVDVGIGSVDVVAADS